MKTIVLTFDDGRIDNFETAFPIMEDYHLTGTIFVTTGYVDGTWQNSSWKSAAGPMTIAQLTALQQSGFELALHGDKHTTEFADFDTSVQKMSDWGLLPESFGFSIPNSDYQPEVLEQIKKAYEGRLLYIRGGEALTPKPLPHGYCMPCIPMESCSLLTIALIFPVWCQKRPLTLSPLWW